MRFFLILLVVSLASLNLLGCATSPPPPKLAERLMAPLIPTDETEIFNIHVKFEDKNNLKENVVQHPGHKIKSYSSIVINVPSNLFEKISKKTEVKQDFKTEDFFNVAEQQIEKVLISKGFRVLSRSKFEAKLRTLRDETRCNLNEYRCLRSQIGSELQPILDGLKRQLDAGEITALKFSDEIQLFKEKFQTSSAGKRRSGEEKELTDISEVIRAAESGNIQADYLLQINEFDTNQKLIVSSNLLHNQQIRNFIRSHPQISESFDNNTSIISCAVSGASLNAKLIHVKTGEIVWIGEHSLNEFSSKVQKILIELGHRRYVSNSEEITSFVRNQNTYQSRLHRYGKKTHIPNFEYKDVLVTPIISSGNCNNKFDARPEIRSKLSRQVARELINTVSVSK